MKCVQRGLSITLLAAIGFTSLAGVAEASARLVGKVPSSTASATYTVRSGDSFFLIANRLGVTVWSLLDANHLKKSSVLMPGQQLIVPVGGVIPHGAPAAQRTPVAIPTPAAAATYTVVSGDGLTVIAQRLGVSLPSLLTANRLVRSSLIYPGMRLSVPAGGHLPSAAPKTATTGSTIPAPTPAAAPAVYVVLAGDGLSIIAQRLGVPVASLLSTNNLRITSVIWPGMRLTVPAGGHLPVAANPAPATTSSSTPDTSVPSVAGAPTPTVSAALQPMINFAFAQQGKAYKFNTAGPDTYDCSGLVMAAFAEIGISLPHRAAMQATFGATVDPSAIQAGDLVFLESSPGSGLIDHVGIAISATQWIHAPRTGDVVRIGMIPNGRVAAVRRLVLP
jgi:LysM repeat protein